MKKFIIPLLLGSSSLVCITPILTSCGLFGCSAGVKVRENSDIVSTSSPLIIVIDHA
jgi:hypothetical protein